MAAELIERLKKELAGTKSSDAPRMTHEERARRDADAMNAEIGHENDSDGYNCDLCKNKGYIFGARGMYVYREDCVCRNARNTIRRMQRSGLGTVISKSFDKFNAQTEWQKQLKDSAQRFVADDSPRWFFVGGASGSGKSHICTSICRKLLATMQVHYMLWEEESKELRSVIMDAEKYQPRMNRLKNIDVLYIDDFFSGHKERDGQVALPTVPEINLARELLNHRYVNGKLTIISSEWYSSEIYEIDAAVGGRIIEMAKGLYCVNLGRTDDKNYRLKLGGEIL